MARTTNRHWKQRWDPNADYVFRRRLRMDGGSIPNFVLPGDPVTPEIRAKLGLNRLRTWWDAEVIQRADFDANVRGSGSAPVVKAPVATPGSVEHAGAGWYVVTHTDGSIEKVRGKDRAEAALRVV